MAAPVGEYRHRQRNAEALPATAGRQYQRGYRLTDASNEPGGRLRPVRFRAARTFVVAMLGVVLWVIGSAAQALDADRHIGQFHHTAWTVKEGAPGQITALAQTADGDLWLATQIGLFRFDGVQFERFELPDIRTGQASVLPATSISTLYAPPGGGLWIGFRYGAVSFLRDDRLTHYGSAQGLPTSTVFRFAQDRQGTLWAATFQGLIRLRDGHWERLGRQWRLPGEQARTVFVDAAGTLWVATEHGVAFLREGATVFERVAAPVGRISQIAQAGDGQIWIAETDRGVRPLPLAASASASPASPTRGGEASTDELAAREPNARALAKHELAKPSAGLLFDRDGVLWASTLGDGLFRLRDLAASAGAGEAAPATSFENFRRTDGLSSDYLLPILEDREGNVWIGSSRGLDRFRHSNVVPALFPDGAQDFAIAPGDAGALLAGSRNQPLMRLQDGRISFLDLPPPITAAHRDREGVVWLGGPNGLWKLHDGRLSEITALPLSGYSGVQALAVDGEGALWVSLNTPGVYRLAQGKWRHYQNLAETPPGPSPLTLLSDSRGQLWMGFARNRIAIMKDGALRPIAAEQGLEVGNVTALAEGVAGVWIGGERGLAFAHGNQLQSVPPDVDGPFNGISGIVETRGGDLWLNAARGIVHVTAAQVRRLFDTKGPAPRYELFDFLDGVPGIPAQFRPIPTAAQASDGRLWFATTSGVVSIDPAAIARNPIAPPVRIQSVQANQRNYRVNPAAALHLPAGIENLQIAYTALSLSIPERVRFRYKLEGFDKTWQEAGTRRTAFYNDPGPGRYTFRVTAANNDGVWNDVGAALSIVIAPRYYQTRWFQLLCLLAALSILGALYLLRLRHLARQIRLRMQERHMERERIARELHDTLLQGSQGLILRLHAATQRLGPQDPVRGDLELAMDLAEQALAEGRDRVRGLRGDVQYWRDLGDALLHVRDEAHVQPLPEMRLIVEGKPRPLLPGVAEELYLIGREAVLNALHHAQAQTVEIELGYSPRKLRLRVRDDGIGMPRHTPNRPGHWGLDGMYERAARIGGNLNILSGDALGTEVDLQLPASAAYPRRRRRSLRWASFKRLLFPERHD